MELSPIRTLLSEVTEVGLLPKYLLTETELVSIRIRYYRVASCV